MSRRALIVDDNPLNQELMRFLLEASGWEVHVAADGRSMDAVLAGLAPDLILMDLGLPGESGLDLTRRLKADPARAAVPIIAVTASAMKGDEEKARAAGCDGYISKPIDTRNFASQIDIVLTSRS